MLNMYAHIYTESCISSHIHIHVYKLTHACLYTCMPANMQISIFLYFQHLYSSGISAFPDSMFLELPCIQKYRNSGNHIRNNFVSAEQKSQQTFWSVNYSRDYLKHVSLAYYDAA